MLQRHSDVNYAITHAIRVLDSQGLRTATYSHHSQAWPKQPRIRDLLVVLVGPACLNLDDISRFTNTPMLLIRQFGRAVSGPKNRHYFNCPTVRLSNYPIVPSSHSPHREMYLIDWFRSFQIYSKLIILILTSKCPCQKIRSQKLFNLISAPLSFRRRYRHSCTSISKSPLLISLHK